MKLKSQLKLIENIGKYDEQLENGLLNSIDNRYRFQYWDAQKEHDELRFQFELNWKNWVFYTAYINGIKDNANTDAEALDYINKELHRIDRVLIDYGLQIESCDSREQNMKKYGVHVMDEEYRELVEHSVELRKNEATTSIERKVILEIIDVVNNIFIKGDNNESE